MGSFYRHGLIVFTKTHGIDDRENTWTHGIDNTYGIHLDTLYSIGTPESHMYEMAECCPYAGFLCNTEVHTYFPTIQSSELNISPILDRFTLTRWATFRSSAWNIHIFDLIWAKLKRLCGFIAYCPKFTNINKCWSNHILFCQISN